MHFALKIWAVANCHRPYGINFFIERRILCRQSPKGLSFCLPFNCFGSVIVPSGEYKLASPRKVATYSLYCFSVNLGILRLLVDIIKNLRTLYYGRRSFKLFFLFGNSWLLNYSHPDNAVYCAYCINKLLGDFSVNVDNAVRVISFCFVYHAVNVNSSGGNLSGKGGNHVCDIFV